MASQGIYENPPTTIPPRNHQKSRTCILASALACIYMYVCCPRASSGASADRGYTASAKIDYFIFLLCVGAVKTVLYVPKGR
jgi:hypothetical protein